MDFRVGLVAVEVALSLLALLFILLGAWQRPNTSPTGAWAVAVLALIALGGFSLSSSGIDGVARSFYGLVVSDRLGAFLGLFSIVSGLLVLFMSPAYLSREGIHKAEYYGLVFLSLVGGFFMFKAASLLTLFLGLEVLSMPLYVLCGLKRNFGKSPEAGLKYFYLGAFFSAVMLYGISFLYGALGTVNLEGLAALAISSNRHGLMCAFGLALLLCGLAFKAGLAPFHAWVPDVYEGAPTTITAFMATFVKVAAFGALIRIIFSLPPDILPVLKPFGWLVAVLTMFAGNLGALYQTNIKRLLAFSSIAHAGYLLVGLLSFNALGQQGVLYYLLAYTFMNVGAFAVVIAFGQRGEENVTLDDLRGMGLRHPFLGVAMALFILSMIGIPPTAGFVGKYYLFAAALSAGMPVLAVLGVLNSVISLGYYLRVLVALFMMPETRAVIIPPKGFGTKVAVAACAVLVLWFGCFVSSPIAAFQGAFSQSMLQPGTIARLP